jgi:hypothetical protein
MGPRPWGLRSGVPFGVAPGAIRIRAIDVVLPPLRHPRRKFGKNPKRQYGGGARLRRGPHRKKAPRGGYPAPAKSRRHRTPPFLKMVEPEPHFVHVHSISNKFFLTHSRWSLGSALSNKYYKINCQTPGKKKFFRRGPERDPDAPPRNAPRKTHWGSSFPRESPRRSISTDFYHDKGRLTEAWAPVVGRGAVNSPPRRRRTAAPSSRPSSASSRTASS